MRETLSDVGLRDQLKEEILTGPRRRNPKDTWITNFTKSRNMQYDGLSLEEIARLRKQDSVDALCDILLDDGLQLSMVGLGTNPQTLPEFVSHPLGMVGSDAVPVSYTHLTLPTKA